MDQNPTRSEFPEDIWHAFDCVWTWAVGKPGYDKSRFMDMEGYLLEMHRRSQELCPRVDVRTCASLPPSTVILVAQGAVQKTACTDPEGRGVFVCEEIDWSKVAAVVNAGEGKP